MHQVNQRITISNVVIITLIVIIFIKENDYSSVTVYAQVISKDTAKAHFYISTMVLF